MLKIYHQLSEFKKLDRAVVTMGTFDGLHCGHQKIIKRLCELAHETGGESVILTFFPHPRQIIDPENQDLKMINTMREKAEMLDRLGVDHLIITPFTRDFSNLSPQDYIKNILVDTIGTRQLIVGYDHRFGKNREGGLRELEAGAAHYGYTIEEIPEQDVNDVAVSSTKVREALLKGDVGLAASYLGYPFSLQGPVVKGDKIGRTIGFPTANIFIEETYKLIPGDGIYAVTVEMAAAAAGGTTGTTATTAGATATTAGATAPAAGTTPGAAAATATTAGAKAAAAAGGTAPAATTPTPRASATYKGMAYIGQRPTINGMTRNIEVNIFDFDQEIYGQTIKMNFLRFLRPDVKFSGLEELTRQLKQDKADTLHFFEKYEKEQ